jgi:hypothetical protein
VSSNFFFDQLEDLGVILETDMEITEMAKQEDGVSHPGRRAGDTCNCHYQQAASNSGGFATDSPEMGICPRWSQIHHCDYERGGRDEKHLTRMGGQGAVGYSSWEIRPE